MTEKELLHQLRRGIGSAIIELKQFPHLDKYKELVLHCCLKDIGYDVQSEGTKGKYLYTAISALGCEDVFLAPIEEAYMKLLPHDLDQQLTDVLQAYVWNGSQKAAKIIKNKYDQRKETLRKQKSFPYRYCEREQFEELMVVCMNLGNWKAFRQAVDDAGTIILIRKDDLCSYYDWFLSCAESRFGKDRVWKYLNETGNASPNVHAFVSAYLENEQTRLNHQANQTPIILEFLLNEVQEYLLGLRPHGIFGFYLQFARKAGKEEFIQLAKYIESETNALVQAQLLRVFYRVDYPLDIDFLIRLVLSENNDLRQAATTALERFKDDRIHGLAVTLLESGDIESGLSLLKENWMKCDDPLIRKAVLKSKRVAHSTQMDLRDIYSKHKSASCGDILSHAYRNGDCAYCRSGIVKAMGKNGVLTNKVLFECQYDSYDKTRQYAKRLIKKRGLEA